MNEQVIISETRRQATPGAVAAPAGHGHWLPMTYAEPPGRREYHTAVWTGKEPIVWGGNFGSRARNTGGRYRTFLAKGEVQELWAEVNTAVPDSPLLARSQHTAVWTGKHMIVWGGAGSHRHARAYDPATDTWSPPTTAGPTGRHLHVAVWAPEIGAMIVWGGSQVGGLHPNTGGIYYPDRKDGWTEMSTAGAAEGRRGAVAVWTGDELVVWGGIRGTRKVKTGGVYHPVSGWRATELEGAPKQRTGHATKTWTTLPVEGCPEGRWGHTAVWMGSEMLVWGGRRNRSTPGGYSRGGGRYVVHQPSGPVSADA